MDEHHSWYDGSVWHKDWPHQVYVGLTYISWSSDFASCLGDYLCCIRDNGSVWHKDRPRKIYVGQWPICHGPLILPLIIVIDKLFLYIKKWYRPRVFMPLRALAVVCIHLHSGQVYCGKENQDADINFCLRFPFFLFSISHSNVSHRKIRGKDIWVTTLPSILKFGTNVGYDLLYCVRETQPPPFIIPFICPFLFLSSQIFCNRFLGFYERQSSNSLYSLKVAKYIVGKKTKMLRLILSFFFPLSLQCNT